MQETSLKGLIGLNAEKKVVEELKNQGLLEKIEEITHSVGHCYRCKTVIEPLVSKQWFVKTKPLARPAKQAVLEGNTKFFPESWTKTYFEWLDNIRDWCISRQIWWGHRIPAWTCNQCGKLSVSTEDLKTCPGCGSRDIVQEEDVLDTWFSSALCHFPRLDGQIRQKSWRYTIPHPCLLLDLI